MGRCIKVGDRILVTINGAVYPAGSVLQVHYRASSCSGCSYLDRVEVQHDDGQIKEWFADAVKIIDS
tara:strand:+ start:261 stop:461 length:201 start_codon:yes stop_codon:yes gene_type:complete